MDKTNKQDESRKLAMLMHWSQLSSYIIPLAGAIVPIVIWRTQKEQYPELDAHGRAVMNWILSAVIYGAAFALLTGFAIGVPLLLALALANIGFAVMGGLRAKNGAVWKYPLAFEFLKMPGDDAAESGTPAVVAASRAPADS